MTDVTTVLLIALGGALGTVARYLLALAALPISASLPSIAARMSSTGVGNLPQAAARLSMSWACRSTAASSKD